MPEQPVNLELSTKVRPLDRANQVVAKLKEKIPTRQALMVTTAAGLLLMTTACGSAETVEPPKQQPVLPTPISEMLPRPNEQQPEYSYLPDPVRTNFKVAINSQGLPVKYIKPDGTEVMLNTASVRQAREKAISLQEPEVVDYIYTKFDSPARDYRDFPSEKHPELSNLPSDALSENELKKRGVEIIQTDTTKLSIRKNAFDKGEPLEAFNSTGRKLKIVLVDGPVVTKNLLTDSRYAGVRELLNDQERSLEKYRREQIAKIEAKLDWWKQHYKEKTLGPGFDMTQQGYESAIISMKSGIYRYEHLDYDKLLIDMQGRKGGEVGGLYFAPTSTRKEAVIFIAVGTADVLKDTIVIYFDSTGTSKLTYRLAEEAPIDFTPRIRQSHPDPFKFDLNTNASPDQPNSYPFGAQTPGQILLHELAHDELITERANHGLKPDHSEYNTDVRAMERIRNAWDKWEASGYKDDSGYFFIFSLPEGGYILTKEVLQASPSPDQHI